MAKTKDFYDVLGLPRTAGQKEIGAAFRKLARKHHPDLNAGDKEAEARFKEISKAHEVLSDPKKKSLYDEFGSNWAAAQAAGVQPGAGGGRRGADSGRPPVRACSTEPSRPRRWRTCLARQVGSATCSDRSSVAAGRGAGSSRQRSRRRSPSA